MVSFPYYQNRYERFCHMNNSWNAMGPSFSGLISVMCLALVWPVAYGCAGFFRPAEVAVRLAALFASGAFAGTVAIAAVSGLSIGTGGTLTSARLRVVRQKI
jgi:hypothetical protein